MRLNKYIALAASTFALMGCRSMPIENTMKPALLSEASIENTEVLTMAVSKALNGTKVSLATDTFTEKNTFTLERMAQDKIGQEGMNGRIMGIPEAHSFALFSKGDMCYLVYEKTGQEIPLENISCKSM